MKALVLAGGFPQIALLQELNRRGIETVLADYYEEPVAKPYADRFYQVSTLDVEGIKAVAQRESVDFLITACTDQALLTVAKVSEKLGLPCYIDYQTALNVTNKQYMKQVFNAHNIPTARHVVMGELCEEKLADMQFPLIVKPVDCNSSKGVKRVETLGELKTAFEDAVRFSRTNTALVEEFIDGEEISVDVYVENGTAHVLSVSMLDKISDNDKFVIFRGRYGAHTVERVHEMVRRIAQQIADAFGLKNSPMLIQMIVNDERAAVLEFSARTGGGVKYLLIRKASGFDVIAAVVDLTLGKKPHIDKVSPQNRYIVNEFIYCSPGVFERLDGFDEAREKGWLSDYYLFKPSGTVFDTIENSGDRVAGYTVQADTLEELERCRAAVLETVRVLDKTGRDMLRRDLLTALPQY